MYGIYANIWGILMVNVTIYGIHTDPMGYSQSISVNSTPRDTHHESLSTYLRIGKSRMEITRKPGPFDLDDLPFLGPMENIW